MLQQNKESLEKQLNDTNADLEKHMKQHTEKVKYAFYKPVYSYAERELLAATEIARRETAEFREQEARAMAELKELQEKDRERSPNKLSDKTDMKSKKGASSMKIAGTTPSPSRRQVAGTPMKSSRNLNNNSTSKSTTLNPSLKAPSSVKKADEKSKSKASSRSLKGGKKRVSIMPPSDQSKEATSTTPDAKGEEAKTDKEKEKEKEKDLEKEAEEQAKKEKEDTDDKEEKELLASLGITDKSASSDEEDAKDK